MPKPPVHWQDATAATISRIQHVFSIHPALTVADQIALYERAQAAVHAQDKARSAGDYWSTFVNTLRTLVAGMTNVNPKETFD